MRYIFLLFILFPSIVLGDSNSNNSQLLIGDSNGTNAGRYRSLKFSNGTTTNNNDGSISVNNSGGASTSYWNSTNAIDVYNTNSGNVGIGSIAPTDNLAVNALANSGITINGAIVGAGGIDANTALILHLDNNTTDSETAAAPKTVTNNAGVTFTTSPAKFNYSAVFNGTTQYLSTPDDASLHFGSGDFTVDFWIYITALPTNSGATQVYGIGGQWGAVGNRGWNLTYNNNGAGVYRFEYAASANGTTVPVDLLFTTTLSTSSWNHVALVSSGGTVNVYVNGTSVSSGIGGTVFASTANYTIGFENSNSAFFPGQIDEYRVSPGIARWTSGFTPAGPYTSSIAKPILTFNNNGVIASQLIYASDTNNFSIKNNGNTAIIINSSGNVGVGTSNPGFQLDINGTSRMTGFTLSSGSSLNNKVLTSDTNGNGTWQTSASGSGTVDSGTANYATYYPASTAEVAATAGIQFSGTNVGINKAPSQNLDVNGTVIISGNLGIGSTAPGGLMDIQGTLYHVFVGVGGNVGIGTYTAGANNPAAPLDIPLASPGIILGARGIQGGIQFRRSSDANTSASVGYTSSSVFQMGESSGGGSTTVYQGGSGSVFLDTAGLHRVVVNTSGNVAIGPGTPAQFLDVQGTVSTNHFFNVTSVGNVGIGTVNPQLLLAVGTTGQFQVSSAGAASTTSTNGFTSNAYPSFFGGNNGTAGATTNFYGSNNNSGQANLISTTSGGTTLDSVNLKVGNNGSTIGLTVFDNNGTANVGINTAIPTASLQVIGNIVQGLANTGTASTFLNNSPISTGAGITEQLNSLTSGSGVSVTSNSNTFTGQLINAQIQGASSTGSALNITSNGTGTIVKITNTGTGATLTTSTGNVGIGSLTPGQVLDIFGTMRLSGSGHIVSVGTAPTVANNDCGTTSQGTVTAGSTDMKGSFTAGTLTVTSCAITLAGTFIVAPTCITQDDTNILGVKTTCTTTKCTTTSTTSMSGDIITYICVE